MNLKNLYAIRIPQHSYSWSSMGGNAEYFSDFGTKLGFSFSTFLNTKHGYHFGVLSNLDLKPVFSSARDPFHHGLIVLRDESPPVTTTMFVTHGDPRSAAYRKTEFNKVCTKIKSERDLGSRILVVGDLNSVSYIDDYDGDTFCSDKYLNRKFCMEGQAAEDGVIDYDPINVLKACTTPNLIDLGLPQDWTVPTPYGRTVSPEHATNLRLDYILASNDIHVTCTDTASWDNGSGYTCTRGYGDTVAGGPWCYYDSKDGGFNSWQRVGLGGLPTSTRRRTAVSAGSRPTSLARPRRSCAVVQRGR